MNAYVHWNLAKQRRGIYEFSVTVKGKVDPARTNNITIKNPKLHLLDSAWKAHLNSPTGKRTVYAQVRGELVDYIPLPNGRVISCNPKEHATPNFYDVETKQDLPFGACGEYASFTIVDGKPVCTISE